MGVQAARWGVTGVVYDIGQQVVTACCSVFLWLGGGRDGAGTAALLRPLGSLSMFLAPHWGLTLSSEAVTAEEHGDGVRGL